MRSPTHPGSTCVSRLLFSQSGPPHLLTHSHNYSVRDWGSTGPSTHAQHWLTPSNLDNSLLRVCRRMLTYQRLVALITNISYIYWKTFCIIWSNFSLNFVCSFSVVFPFCIFTVAHWACLLSRCPCWFPPSWLTHTHLSDRCYLKSCRNCWCGTARKEHALDWYLRLDRSSVCPPDWQNFLICTFCLKMTWSFVLNWSVAFAVCLWGF